MNIPVSDALLEDDSGRTLSLHVTDDQVKWIQRRAKALGVSESQFVRYMLNRWMQAEQKHRSTNHDREAQPHHAFGSQPDQHDSNQPDKVSPQRPQPTPETSEDPSHAPEQETDHDESPDSSVMSLLRDSLDTLEQLQETEEQMTPRRPPAPPDASADNDASRASDAERHPGEGPNGKRRSSHDSLFDVVRRSED